MPTPLRSAKQQAQQKPGEVSDEKMQGVLENVFGIKLPEQKQNFETSEEQKFAGVLENVFGVRLPSEMVTRAYSVFLNEYKE